MSDETIIVETKGRVGIIRLNRPQALNALNAELMAEVNAAVDASRPTTASAASSSPARKRRSRPAPTSRRWRKEPTWTPISSDFAGELGS